MQAGGFNAWELREEGQEAEEDEERMGSNVWYNMHREIVERQIMQEMSRYGKVRPYFLLVEPYVEPWFVGKLRPRSVICNNFSDAPLQFVGVELVCEPQTIISRLKLCLVDQWNVEAWKEVFLLGDKDNSGGLDREELRRILQHFDVSVTTEELKVLWNFIDISADAGGTIEFWELVEAFRFDDWEEELETMMTTKKSVGPRSRQSSKMQFKYPCHAIISCADEETANRILVELNGHSVRFHDEEGRDLSPKELVTRGMLPMNRAPIAKEEKEKMAGDGVEKKPVHKSLRLALQGNAEKERKAKSWKPELFWSISNVSGAEDEEDAPRVP